MIAVEWEDDARQRSGVLHSFVNAGRVDGRDNTIMGLVITRRFDGDPWVKGPVVKDRYPTVILQIEAFRLRVKGVHIPFEPHGAEK